MGGETSGRRKVTKEPRHKASTSESRKAFNEKRAARRVEALAMGLCTLCYRRTPDPGRLDRQVTCQPCRDALDALRAELEAPPRPVDFCLECLGANFHRGDCPTMASMISLDERIERVLNEKVAPELGPLEHDKPVPHAGKPLTPDSMEDGRSRDEGLPEFGWGETECPVPAGVNLDHPTQPEGHTKASAKS